MATEKILIVDDDVNICELLRLYLEKEGYSTEVVNNGLDAVTVFSETNPNLVLLDIMLPGLDGWQICREIRKTSQTPIIMLTAKGEVFDKVLGLELGADDYIVKPFEPKELLLRIYSILRRTEMILEKQRLNQLRFGNCLYDIERQELSKDGGFIALTPVESELMHLLVSQIGCEVSREELARLTKTENERTIDVQVNRLRKKIEEEPKKPRYLQTVRGKGYLLLAD